MPPKSYRCSSTIVHTPSRLRMVAGDTVTLDELRAAGQSDEDIERLVADGALDGEYDGHTPAEKFLREELQKEEQA